MNKDLARYVQKHYSQCGEAGIINRLLHLVGAINCVALEFGGGDGYNLSNTRHLADLGWRVVMFDGRGDEQLVHREFVTAENINDLITKYDIPPDFDVLSLDIDGNDYWIWRAIEARPRIVVIEFNGTVPVGVSKTVPYDSGFVHDGTDYYGVSLALLEKLAVEKGYTLVFQLNGLNAFFVRDDLVVGSVQRVTYQPLQYHPPDKLGRPWVFL